MPRSRRDRTPRRASRTRASFVVDRELLATVKYYLAREPPPCRTFGALLASFMEAYVLHHRGTPEGPPVGRCG